MTAAEQIAADLAVIKNLLALQLRLSAGPAALDRDGDAWTDTQNDLAAVCRGDLEKVGVRQHRERLDLGEQGVGGVFRHGVPDPEVVDEHRVVHNSSPSSVGDTPSVGVDVPVAGPLGRPATGGVIHWWHRHTRRGGVR